MNTRQQCLKRIAKLGLLLMLGASMNVEAGLFGGTSWKEEVLLHDGSKIIVERSVSRGGRHEIGQQPAFKEQSLIFTMPTTKQKITWEDKYSEDVGSANFLPMLLDIFNGTPYLVVDPMGCLSYNKWGRPNPPYVVFKYQDSEWQRIPLQELPAEIKLPNMLHSSPDDVAEKSAKGGVVPATVIRHENDGYRQPEYKTILREQLPEKRIKEMCEEQVSDGKGGWMSIDWFTSQPTYEACLIVCNRNGMNSQRCPCATLFKGNEPATPIH